MKKITLFLILILAFTVSACSKDSNSTNNGNVDTVNANEQTGDKPVIYTTFYALEYITQTLIGDNATVYGLTSNGGDIHSYDPTMKDMENINNADMFIFLGKNVEASSKQIADSLDSDKVTSLEISLFLDNSDLVELNHDEDEEEHKEDEEHKDGEEQEEGHSHEDINQHVWILPTKNIEIAKVIRDSLIEKYPDLADSINENYNVLESELLAVESSYVKELQESDNRLDTAIVSHDAYKYFIKYGIKTVPVKDESSSKDPTQKELNEIIELGKSLDIKYVLYDENIPCVPLDTVRDEIGAEGLTISNLTVISEDDRKNGLTLIDLFDKNLKTLKKAIN